MIQKLSPHRLSVASSFRSPKTPPPAADIDPENNMDVLFFSNPSETMSVFARLPDAPMFMLMMAEHNERVSIYNGEGKELQTLSGRGNYSYNACGMWAAFPQYGHGFNILKETANLTARLHPRTKLVVFAKHDAQRINMAAGEVPMKGAYYSEKPFEIFSNDESATRLHGLDPAFPCLMSVHFARGTSKPDDGIVNYTEHLTFGFVMEGCGHLFDFNVDEPGDGVRTFRRSDEKVQNVTCSPLQFKSGDLLLLGPDSWHQLQIKGRTVIAFFTPGKPGPSGGDFQEYIGQQHL